MGCNNISSLENSINSFESNISSFFSGEITSISLATNSNSSSVTIIEGSSLNNETSTEIEKSIKIKEIKEKALNYLGKENEVGIYESNEKVNIELAVISCLDAITTKTGYGDRYKILMSDGEDYIYIKTNRKNYEYLEKYVQNRGVYLITGNISLYNKEVEITVSDDIVYLENKTISINYNSLAKKVTLQEAYDLMSQLTLNCKGVSFSKIVQIEVKCLAKDINNTNLYFGNGDKIINIHGHDKVTNNFVVGNSYVLYGALNVYNFRPGLEYVYHTSLNKDIVIDYSNLDNKKASDFYAYTYETDEETTYPNYSKLFENPYIVEGYVNSYLKDGKEYIVLEDNYNENYYSTYQNAKDAKSIFFVNENYIKITSSNSQFCPIYEHLELGSKLKVVVFPYLWNTQKYPQVYCYSFNVIDNNILN